VGHFQLLQTKHGACVYVDSASLRAVCSTKQEAGLNQPYIVPYICLIVGLIKRSESTFII